MMNMPFTFDFEFRDENGVLIARRTCHNLVTTAGKNLVGNVFFGATAKSADWYVGLKGSGTAAAADTMATHAGWSEITAYSETVRQTLTMSAFSGGSATNSGSPAVFTINSASTIAGAFIVNSNTKAGTTGTLYNAADFSAPVTLSAGTVTVNGIVLNI
jgi:hypothetical protein